MEKTNQNKYSIFLINNKQLKLLIFIANIFINEIIKIKYKKVGIIGLPHSQNIGNNLLKYAMYIKLTELGFKPYIIGQRYGNDNISFILNNVKVILINKSFNEINRNDYDILMVNSDQTWRKDSEHFFYDIGFLNFSKNWEIPKFVYGASLGFDYWDYTKKEEDTIKSLLKNFKGISVREKGSVKLIDTHLGIKPIFVLDPTLLINKKYYLNIIKNFKIDKIFDNNFIFVYTLTNSKELNIFIKNITEKYNNKIYIIDVNVANQIEKFIYGIYKSKADITDSFHGAIFSIIFNKPFISFVYEERGIERFNSLKEIFNLQDRIVSYNSSPDYNLIEKPLKINKNLINYLKKKSIRFLKSNLFF